MVGESLHHKKPLKRFYFQISVFISIENMKRVFGKLRKNIQK